MISLKVPTQTPTVQLSSDQRDGVAELLAQRYLDGMDIRDLERFFLEITIDAYSSYSDEELLGELEDMTDEQEFNELIEAIVNEA